MKLTSYVWRAKASAHPWEGHWLAQVWDQEWENGGHVDPHWSIEDCPAYRSERFHTHAEAVAYALAEVGLSSKDN